MGTSLSREVKIQNANHVKRLIREVATDSDLRIIDVAERAGTSIESTRHALRINKKSTQFATLLPLLEAVGLELVVRRKQS